MHVCTWFLTKHTRALKGTHVITEEQHWTSSPLAGCVLDFCWTLFFFLNTCHSKQRSMCSVSVFKNDLSFSGSAAPLQLQVYSVEMNLKLLLMFQRSYSMLVKVYKSCAATNQLIPWCITQDISLYSFPTPSAIGTDLKRAFLNPRFCLMQLSVIKGDFFFFFFI